MDQRRCLAHPEHPDAPCVLRSPLPCAPRRPLCSVALPQLLHPADRCRHRVVGRRSSLHLADGDRRSAQDLHDDDDRRSGTAQHRSRDATHHPRPLGTAGRWSGGDPRALPTSSSPGDAARHRDHPGKHHSVAQGWLHRERLHTAGHVAQGRDGCGRLPQQREPGHEGAGIARQRFRLIPLGQHCRQPTAGLSDTTLPHPRAAGDGIDGHRRHALCAR